MEVVMHFTSFHQVRFCKLTHVYLSMTWPFFCLFYFVGIVGEIDEGGDGYYIWTHKKLDIGYNNDQIVDVNLTSEHKFKLETSTKIPFTYEVSEANVMDIS